MPFDPEDYARRKDLLERRRQRLGRGLYFVA